MRTALFFPALSAMVHCAPIRAFRDRLLERGKSKMQVVGAGVLRHKAPFKPERQETLMPAVIS